MATFILPKQTALQIFGVAALLCCGALAHADNAQGQRERQRTYQTDRQRCLSGQSDQSQASCMQEAGAVLQQQQNQSSEIGAAELAKNALRRCDALTGEDHQSCVLRMQGHGKVQGSAATGGILRELSEPEK